MTGETVVTKDGTSINIYIGGQPLTGQGATPTTGGGSLMSGVLWLIILGLAASLILPQFGINLEGVKNTWRQWQMNWMLPVPIATAPMTMVAPIQQMESPPIIATVPNEQVIPLPSAAGASPVSPLQPVAWNSETCNIGGRIVSGLHGYSRPVADGSIKNLPNQVCYQHCIMQITSVEQAQVEVFNSDRDMRYVGNWSSTGKYCGSGDGLNELVENNKGEVQKTFLSLAVPLYYGYEYAEAELQKLLNRENKEKKPEAGTGAGWSLWDLLPGPVKGLGIKGLLILVAVLLLFTNFSGIFGKIIAVVVVIGIFLFVFGT